jgi:hypothetical protein
MCELRKILISVKTVLQRNSLQDPWFGLCEKIAKFIFMRMLLIIHHQQLSLDHM